MGYDGATCGRVIRALRRKRGWSQEMLSAFAGIGRSHLSMIETGRKEPSVETLCRIADALGYRLSELIRKVEDACDEQNN